MVTITDKAKDKIDHLMVGVPVYPITSILITR